MNIYKFFVFMNDLREGDRRLFFLRQIKNILESDREIIKKYQLDRLKNIIAYSYENTEFYRIRFDQANISPNDINTPSDLLKFPILEKDDIRSNLSSMLSKEIAIDSLIKSATGGTTSSPVPLYLDKECCERRRAATLFFFKWFNYEIGNKIAYLWGAEQDYSPKKSLKQKIKNLFINRSMFLQTSYLNNDILQNYYEKLNKFRPKVLQAYPTPLFLLANYMKKNNLNLNIEHINVAAEYLYDYQREMIEHVFNTKIFNWYGARELGHVATECSEHYGMHINVSGVYIEVIKNNKQVVNEEGDIVVTDLLNKAMPLIRYRIGDRGILSTRTCKCGSTMPILENIGGRYVDTFKKVDGSSIPGVALTNRIISECKGIQELQIIQKDFKLFHLNIVKGEQYSEINLEDVKRKISLFMHDNIEFKVSFVNKIIAESSGKVRFCKSEINNIDIC